MAFHIFNTMSRKKEVLEPLDGKKFKCIHGPTVYNYAHIGNFRHTCLKIYCVIYSV